MARIIGVAFERHGRLHYVNPGRFDVKVGQAVLVPTPDGPEVARCVWADDNASWSDEPLLECAGLATDKDLQRTEDNRARRAEAYVLVRGLIEQHDLDMTVVSVDLADRGVPTLTVYFRAPQRVDFRGLHADLVEALGGRIELRHIGLRDAASVVGGVGSCGRELCCSLMKPAEDPISARLAQDQDRDANPLSITGACGRLLCCLAYEQDAYAAFAAESPAIGSEVVTPYGKGEVTGHCVPADAVFVRMSDGIKQIPLTDITVRGRILGIPLPSRHKADGEGPKPSRRTFGLRSRSEPIEPTDGDANEDVDRQDDA